MSEQTNREMMATRIESIIVGLGHKTVTEEIKAEVLPRLARNLGREVNPSERTWDTVRLFLADRFPDEHRTHECRVRGFSDRCVVCGDTVL